MGFTNFGFINQGSKSILFTSPFEDTIYEVESSTIKKKYYFDFHTKSVTEKYKGDREFLVNETHNYNYLLSSCYESFNYFLINYQENRYEKAIYMLYF